MSANADRAAGRFARPPWVSDDAELPDVSRYVGSEQFMAGALSTMPPFSAFHPAWCLPFARQALDAMSEWDPCDELTRETERLGLYDDVSPIDGSLA